jgi:hypothetical protein
MNFFLQKVSTEAIDLKPAHGVSEHSFHCILLTGMCSHENAF